MVRDVVAPPRSVSFVASAVGASVVSTNITSRYPRACHCLQSCAASDTLGVDLSNLRRPVYLLKQRVARAKSESQGGRWHLISRAEFSKRADRARNQRRRSSELVDLVTIGEMAMGSFQRTNDVARSR